MNILTLCDRYFDGWQRHDADAVLAAFAPGGTYEDPATGGPIAGDALRGYMQRLWAAFPDLGFEIGTPQRVDERCVHAEWTMTGTNRGSLNGLPPSGRAVRVPGIDVIRSGDGGIRSVRGHFDSAAVPRQLGLDVIVQPRAIGPFEFGTSTGVRPVQRPAPGAVAVTELIARDDAQVQRVRETSRQLVQEALQQQAGLQWLTLATSGRRMSTVSMWDSVEAMQAAMRGGTHAGAMREFHAGRYADAGFTGVFVPQRFGPFYRRCEGCGRMAVSERNGDACACGRALAAAA